MTEDIPTQLAASEVTAAPVARRRALVWGAVAGLAGMLFWIIGLAMVPTTVHLSDGDAAVASMVRAAAVRLFIAIQLAGLGTVFLLILLTGLTVAVPGGARGGTSLRVGLVAGVLTQALVGTSTVFAAVAVFSAAHGGGAALVASGWAGLFAGFAVSAIPTLVMTVGVVLGTHVARLAPPWVGALGLLSGLAHILAATTFARTGPFALDGPIGLLTPLTTVVWIIALSVVLLVRVAKSHRASP
ncbi:MAG: hypothetical protein GEV10_30285 [Streptosporangiales bacterium]|nr:hypothetical protein [Streptosporangiales bacterium]